MRTCEDFGSLSAYKVKATDISTVGEAFFPLLFPSLPSLLSATTVALAVAWQAGKLCISALPSDIIARLMQQATARIMHDSSRGGGGTRRGAESGREREVGERRACAWRLGSSLVNVLITFPLHSQPASLFNVSLLPSSTAPPPPPSVCHLCALKQTNSKIFVC